MRLALAVALLLPLSAPAWAQTQNNGNSVIAVPLAPPIVAAPSTPVAPTAPLAPPPPGLVQTPVPPPVEQTPVPASPAVPETRAERAGWGRAGQPRQAALRLPRGAARCHAGHPE